MKAFLFAAICGIATAANAGNLTCAQDENSFSLYCYITKSVKVNGDLRATQLYTGGPKSIDNTGYLSLVDCKIGYLELRDKKGVAFARGIPEKKHVIEYVRYVCEEKTAKQDVALR